MIYKNISILLLYHLVWFCCYFFWLLLTVPCSLMCAICSWIVSPCSLQFYYWVSFRPRLKICFCLSQLTGALWAWNHFMSITGIRFFRPQGIMNLEGKLVKDDLWLFPRGDIHLTYWAEIGRCKFPCCRPWWNEF